MDTSDEVATPLGDESHAGSRIGLDLVGDRDIAVVVIRELDAKTNAGVELIARRLNDDGFRVVAPDFTTLRDSNESAALAGRSALDLRTIVEAVIDEVCVGGRRVILVGAGLGGCLALTCSARSDVAGLITICTPSTAMSRRQPKARLASWLTRTVRFIGADTNAPDAYEPIFERIGYDDYSTAVEIETAGFVAASRTTAATLSFAAKRDHVVPLENAQRLFEQIGSGTKELVWLHRSFHRAWIDHDRIAIANRIAVFVSAVESTSSR